MKITTEVLSKEVVSLLIRAREVVDNQVQVDDDKVMTKIGDSWVLVTAKATPKVGVVVKAKLTVPQREAAILAQLNTDKTKKFTTVELAKAITNVNPDQLSHVMTRMHQRGLIHRVKRPSGTTFGPSSWEYFL